MYTNDPANDQEAHDEAVDAILTQPTLQQLYDAIDPLEGVNIVDHQAE